MPKAEVTLPADVSSVPTARHFVESILSGWSRTDLAWVATMVVSELAANAALHARGEDFRVRVSTVAEGIRIEVDDSSLRLPQQRTYSREATTGRGLKLVSELAQEWGVDPNGHGKTVWAVLHADAVRDDDDDIDVDALLDAFDSDEAVGEVTPLFDRKQHPRARTTLFAA